MSSTSGRLLDLFGVSQDMRSTAIVGVWTWAEIQKWRGNRWSVVGGGLRCCWRDVLFHHASADEVTEWVELLHKGTRRSDKSGLQINKLFCGAEELACLLWNTIQLCCGRKNRAQNLQNHLPDLNHGSKVNVITCSLQGFKRLLF